MPAKNSVKIYLEGSHYHLYNRGVSKDKIFLDDQDYKIFMHNLEKYLDPKSDRSLSEQIKLIAFCLMPNHFHLLVNQTAKDGITKLMRALCTSYVMYFNNKYQRQGTLFQGIFKAAHVDEDAYFLHISRYIHLNPLGLTSSLADYPYSSYGAYLSKKNLSWVDPTPVLSFFKERKDNKPILVDKYFSYKSFVEDYPRDSKNELGTLSID